MRAGALLKRAGRPPTSTDRRTINTSSPAVKKQRVMIAMALACNPDPGHRRRADDRAGCHGAGAGPSAAEGPATRSGPRDALHHARPVGTRRGLRRHRGDVRRPDHRGGPRPTTSSTHPFTPTRRRSRPRSPRSAMHGSADTPEGLGGGPAKPQAIPRDARSIRRCPVALDDCARIVPGALGCRARRGRRAACLLAAGAPADVEGSRCMSRPPRPRAGPGARARPHPSSRSATSYVNFAGRRRV